MTRRRISQHFTVEEFDCHDGTRVPAAAVPALERLAVEWLEPFRREFGPTIVLSGYRTSSYNRRVGGAAGSYHLNYVTAARSLDGLAADLRPARGTVSDWYRWAVALRADRPRLGRAGRGGIGRYPTQRFVHLDTGPRREWAG